MVFDYRTLLKQLASSLFGTRNTNRRLTVRRLRFFAIFSVLFVYSQIASWVFLALDHLCYPRFRRVDLADRTLLIVGNFRSGSTFLHRLLAADEESFTAFKTWEIYLAPSILQRKLLRGVKIVDSWFGAPVYRALVAWDREFLQSVPLHSISLWKPEEDVGLLLYNWYGLFSWFFFPDPRPAETLIEFDDRVNPVRRRRVIGFYAGCLKRHLYVHGERRIVVSKNPSFSPMIASLVEHLPGVRFIGLVRDPVETVASTLAWFSFAWHFFADPIERYPFQREVITMVRSWFGRLRQAESLPVQVFRTIRFEELVGRTVETVESIYAFLDRSIPESQRLYLEGETRRARSHTPDGRGHLDRMDLDPRWLADFFRDTIAHHGFTHGDSDHTTGGTTDAGISHVRAVDST